MAGPRMTEAEALNQATFAALMWALSYPGRPRDLARRLARTGGRARPADSAAYQFYPALDDAALSDIARAPTGTYRYPDESATLVLACGLGAGRELRLSGPGVLDQAALRVGGVPDALWELRAQACHFPLGWDIFLVAGRQVVGLPRTTTIEVR
jgi:alpha-D-ribose 1-methylphosphonate 5-triphosphate synthase subunit PhnH